jgi:hypothetical protein
MFIMNISYILHSIILLHYYMVQLLDFIIVIIDKCNTTDLYCIYFVRQFPHPEVMPVMEYEENKDDDDDEKSLRLSL